jgi:hypothetical protein
MRAHVVVAEPTQIGIDTQLSQCPALYNRQQTIPGAAITVEVCSAYEDNCMMADSKFLGKSSGARDAIRKRLRPHHDRHSSKHTVL